MSFHLSFHLGYSSRRGAYWLDDPPDVTCKDSTASTPQTIRGCLVSSCQWRCTEQGEDDSVVWPA